MPCTRAADGETVGGQGPLLCAVVSHPARAAGPLACAVVPRNVICISRATGAGGEEIGALVAQRLGFKVVDEEIILEAARKADVDPEVVASAEERKSLIERLFGNPAAGGGLDVISAHGALVLPEPNLAPESFYRDLIRDVILETASGGNVVIVAHAASYPLAGRDDVLRVLVTASPGVRAGRLGEQSRLSSRKAEKAIRESDAARADYLKRFYGVQEELPTGYDLVVSTDVLSPARAAEIVAQASLLSR